MLIKYISLLLVLLLTIGCGYKIPNKDVPSSRTITYPTLTKR
jgi:hypothetical protein